MHTPTTERQKKPGFYDELGPLNVAVFVSGESLRLIHLEEDGENASADAAASGYTYAGVMGINAGIPRVHIEPGYEAVMLRAGVRYAEMLGPHLKEYQLRMFSRAESAKKGSK